MSQSDHEPSEQGSQAHATDVLAGRHVNMTVCSTAMTGPIPCTRSAQGYQTNRCKDAQECSVGSSRQMS